MSIRKILITTAALALTVPLMTATPSFAGGRGFVGGWAGNAGGVHVGGGGVHVGGGGGHHGGGGGGWHHGGGRGWGGGGGFFPGAVAGALIGGAIASSNNAYYGPQYGYYDQPDYYDQGPVVTVAPDDGGDAVGYCSQRFRSYDPASGTYLGYDGLRHPCP